ncbi:hypothetical protein E4U43_001330 [Claviceps pusilla]|uniref:P-loop containing nucleoside triphosphate hydrolase protein n=1 Tax=Claviceps pusilla TaxID=123648 RepID=A0A9P7N953_9HYPO|nr:hypothetical protein E4U43_001330 [Claviceps pusilla]
MHTRFEFRAGPSIAIPSISKHSLEPPSSTPSDSAPFVFGLQKMSIQDDSDDVRKKLRLLRLQSQDLDDREIVNTPIFTEAVRRHIDGHHTPDKLIFSQHGLLGGEVAKLRQLSSSGSFRFGHDDMDIRPEDAPFLHYNVTAPSSTFICGSQGSGKSHTLSCLLENCLLASDANTLPKPLTGIVFHYDGFSSDANGQPCEAAHLSSSPDVSVRVLCAPTNVGQIKSTYAHLKNVQVQELRLSQRNLNTRRMLDLMAVSSIQGGGMPLYFHVLTRILKEMRIKQQQTGGHFDYRAFKQALKDEKFSRDQNGPLEQRLETLESFLAPEHVAAKPVSSRHGWVVPAKDTATKWEGEPGQLTIVDLSCPCVTAESACALFNICLSLFLEQNSKTGRVVALDEAHKYMTDSAESQALTESLLATIRLQRHLGARVIIATQEPTISPKLLDLCSVTIVHRFTSPDWLQSLKKHLAAAAQPGLISSSSSSCPSSSSSSSSHSSEQDAQRPNSPDTLTELFARIVALRQGEALLFCPSAIVGVLRAVQDANGADPPQDGFADWAKSQNQKGALEGGGRGLLLDDGSGNRLVRLGCGVMHVRVRERVTEDGGRSIMAG